MNDIFKSIWAVFAGMLIGAILSIGTDFLLESFGVFPPIADGLFVTWMLALALFYRCVFTILGGYVTSKLAPKNPMKHAVILGSIGVVVSAIGTIVAWDLSDHWYPIALILLTLPCTYLGAKLQMKN
jgi:hypothetical protein